MLHQVVVSTSPTDTMVSHTEAKRLCYVPCVLRPTRLTQPCTRMVPFFGAITIAKVRAVNLILAIKGLTATIWWLANAVVSRLLIYLFFGTAALQFCSTLTLRAHSLGLRVCSCPLAQCRVRNTSLIAKLMSGQCPVSVLAGSWGL